MLILAIPVFIVVFWLSILPVVMNKKEQRVMITVDGREEVNKEDLKVDYIMSGGLILLMGVMAEVVMRAMLS